MFNIKSFLVLILSVLVLAACSGETSGKESGDLSGELNFYTSQPDADAEQLVEAYKEKYPDVDVSIYRSGTEEVISKIQAEKEAGDVQADVLLVADAVTFESLKQQEMLLSYESEEAGAIPANFVDEENMYFGTKVMSTALVVNTENVTDLPTSWNVLTEEAANNNMIMPSPLYSGAAAYNLGVITRDDRFGWDFYENIEANGATITQGNGAVLKGVAAGEADYGMVVDFIVARAEAEGSPVTIVYPEEGVPVITEPIGIMKDAENEDAAKAFVDFVLSEEGQQLAVDIGYTPIREGMDAPEGLKTIDEMDVIEADVKELYKSREEDKGRFNQLFGE
ncbi:ABC transporter substrate-binding protein [Saliterribacillus persicus]|uniref:Iron(III) transport system substrate-binding protein n=1 Tax=Saliterribacillus persicus TaxID=930114 RepID=A0A368Y495_9BACI|nr:ABC transporter substrate-binding protein [Saliterribacillus persicus]RCW74925.1 iron(III) transport system substrate-binding protein [Saliterribacillus persicus]